MTPQRRWVLLLTIALSLFALPLLWSFSRRGDCRALRAALEQARTNYDWNCLTAYYRFREYEVPDAEAWRRAVERVDWELANLSNAVARCP